jgi:hypothetical protein
VLYFCRKAHVVYFNPYNFTKTTLNISKIIF